MPEAYRFLFNWDKAWRYRVCPGGRGRGASWNYIRALLAIAYNPVKLWHGQSKVIILCCREVQRSIKQSTWRLLKDQIERLEFTPYFDITDTSIICKHNRSEFAFEGLLRNTNRIKSWEGADICDVEEAEAVSEQSWVDLIPTIRKEYRNVPKINGEYPHAEIWVRYNPKYVDDATQQRFVVNTPPNCLLKKLTWRDNPEFPDVLKQEMKQDYAYRPATARNIWEGECLAAGRRVWSEFNENVHVRSIPMEEVKKHGCCYMAMDPAQHYYPACIWVAIMPKQGQKGFYRYIYNEWPKRETLGEDFHTARTSVLYTGSVLELAQNFYNCDGTAQYGIKIKDRFIDTRFAKGTGSGSYFSNSTEGIVGEFAKRENGGIQFNCPAPALITAQRGKIIQDLQVNTLMPIGPMNEPGLVVAPWCTNTIISLKNHRLLEGSEEEDPKYKDFSDTLKIIYAGMDGAKWDDPEPPQEHTAPAYPEFAVAGMGGRNGWMS